MDTWTFLWLMLFLKIPIVALFLLVRWAVRQTPETQPGGDGGIGPRPRPRPLHPYHPRPQLARRPRRGPHGEPSPATPPRVRAVIARGRSVKR
ncbi:MAG: hypothetical protein ABSG95_07515 [Solirubrobacteraceae bacterium]